MRIFTHESRALGDMLPPWWYALGREDFQRGEQHYYVLPVALLVRLGCWVRYRWDWLRSRPFSNKNRAAYFEGERAGYDRGYAAGSVWLDEKVNFEVPRRFEVALAQLRVEKK